jgi:putative serine protease PepD
MTQNPYGQQPVPRQESPWWAQGAQNEPWRDPRSPSYTTPTQQLPNAPWTPASSAQPTPPTPKPPRARMGAVIAVALVTGLLAGGVAGAGTYAITRQSDNGIAAPRKGTPLGAPAAANRAPGSIADIAASTLPSVVSIQTATASSQGTGSGFVIRKDGYILTNNHVVAKAVDGGDIKVVFKDGSSTPATIVGHDPYSDIAVIKVPKSNLPAVSLGDSSSIAVGDPVVAVGSPLGLAGTVTSGIISALDRPVQAGGSESSTGESSQTYISAIQTDAAINPGNSGGPLLDGDARVIGVNSAIATLTSGTGQAGSIGLGFAIPINQAKRVAQQLIATGKATRTVIGASVDGTYKGTVDGVKLNDVTANGPAQKAGLHAGDVITQFGGKTVDDPVGLIAQIRAQEPGSAVKVVYYRDGRKATATVTLGAA